MIRRPFGSTGFDVSVIGFGASHIGADHCPPREAEQVLNSVLDFGINFIDTAVGYGRSEERIGQYLARRRDEFVLSSKCGYGVEGVPDWTGECVAQGVDQALRRMGTDRIDVMHLHSCPAAVLRDGGVVEALVAAREQGKIRAAAYSGENDDRAFALSLGVFDVIQTSVNICDQRVLDQFLPAAQQANLGVIAKRPLANAFWRHQTRPHGDYCEEYWLRAQAMDIAPGPFDWAELAIRFTAHQPGVHTCIAGTAKLDNLRTNIAHVENGPLPGEVVEEIRQRFRQADQGWTGQV